MKNFILIMLISTLNMYASNSYSQQTKLSMELNGSSLKEVLREIRKQTEFTVLYRSSDVRDVAELDADFEDATVMEILDQCLKGTSLGYEVKDKVIVIYPVDYVPEPVIKKTVQEKKTITGTVTDTDGVPLPGVSVIIKGTSTGVATDIDGNYSLDIEQERAVLVFSFVGMLSQERNYTGK
ncbi:MAG: carboxypeptidase-like regulatory domain-containing protein, partial [Marinifilum sp.]|nr:carboxypeptidase-like regulatory domain-containing protein [Marinifilum sp.]